MSRVGWIAAICAVVVGVLAAAVAHSPERANTAVVTSEATGPPDPSTSGVNAIQEPMEAETLRDRQHVPAPSSIGFFATTEPRFGNDVQYAISNLTKIPISADCGLRLENLGATFVPADWAYVEAFALRGYYDNPSCFDLEDLIRPANQQRPIVGQLFQTTANTDGGFYVVDNTKQWLSQTCIDSLRSAGANIIPVPWADLAGAEQRDDLIECDRLQAEIAARPALGFRAENFTAPSEVEGYETRNVRILDTNGNTVRELRGYAATTCQECGPIRLVSVVAGEGAHVSWDGRFQIISEYNPPLGSLGTDGGTTISALDRSTGMIVRLGYQGSRADYGITTGQFRGHLWIWSFGGGSYQIADALTGDTETL